MASATPAQVDLSGWLHTMIVYPPKEGRPSAPSVE